MEALPDAESLPDSESLPDGESLPDAESLPDDGESLPDAESLPESDPEILSLVVPVPGEMPSGDDLRTCRDRKDDLPHTCCARNCTHRIETECAHQLREWQTLRNKLGNDDVNDFVFKLLVLMRGLGEAPKSGNFRFKLFGQTVCRNGFREAIGISNSRLSRL